jgi:hypothetical protein
VTQLAVLCASPGTSLSRLAARLRSEFPTWGFLDAENEIQALANQRLAAEDNACRNMGDVCERFTRGQVGALWVEVAQSWLGSLSVAGSSQQIERAVLASHLTYFNRASLEFYSAFNVRAMMQAEGAVAVDRVVVVIDDIFDVWRRLPDLRGPAIERMLKQSGPAVKLHGLDPSNEAIDALLRYEARVTSLQELLHWRRSEIIHAENLARQFDAPLFILGLKHPLDSFRIALGAPQPQRIYISHRISEPRRAIHSALRSGNQPTWSPFVDEVGDFSKAVSGSRCVVIMPTAIDELRWQAREGSRLNEPSMLTPRWPLPGSEYELAYEAGAGEDASCTDVVNPLVEQLTSAVEQVISSGAAEAEDDAGAIRAAAAAGGRRLEEAIYDEIAFRDHMIVENSDHLLLYRPFVDADPADGRSVPRFSSGVARELEHWRRCREAGEYHRRLLLVHLIDDILPFFRPTDWLSTLALLYRGLLRKQASLVWGIREDDDLDALTARPSVHIDHLWRGSAFGSDAELEAQRAKTVANALRAALIDQLSYSYGHTGRDPRVQRDGVAVVIRSRRDELFDAATVERTRAFFAGEVGGIDVSEGSWDVLCAALGCPDLLSLARWLITEDPIRLRSAPPSQV